MRRVWLGIVAMVGAAACGQTESDPSAPTATGGAAAGAAPAGGASSGASSAGASGLGAAAGTAGSSQVLEAVAECERYCETLDYKLPQALCEDWHRPGWDPEFCHLVGATSTCAEYCSTVYETITPACAQVLPPVIRCVSRTYANVNVPLLTECWLKDCRDQLFTMTSVCYGLQAKLAAARAVWAASGVVEYRLQYGWSSDTMAEVVVQAGREPTVTPPGAVAWTVPLLFDEVDRYLLQPGVAPDASYDPDLGYVVRVLSQQGCEENHPGVSGVKVTPLR